MSSYRGLVHFLVLLGVMFDLGKPACQFVSVNLKHTVTSIADELKLTESAVGINPLFGSVLSSINNSCQRQTELRLMNATLDVYSRIFSSILQHSHHHHHHDQAHNSGVLGQISTAKRPEVMLVVGKLRNKMEELKSYLNRHNCKSLEDVYGTLDKIKVNDPMVQRKALAEFLGIYQVASVIGDSSCWPIPQ